MGEGIQKCSLHRYAIATCTHRVFYQVGLTFILAVLVFTRFCLGRLYFG